MNTYARELEVRQRMRDRLHEADQERLASMAGRQREARPRTHPGRFALALVRRLTGATGAA
jgi:hypothetical protein